MKKQLNFLIISCFFVLGFTHAQSKQITGVIYDENDIPLLGVSVLEKGTENGVNTDFDGNFKLKLSNNNSIIVIDFLGYKSKEIKVGSKKEFKIYLEPNVAKLDEMVLVGYQSVHEKDVTGAVTSIRSKDLEDIPVVNAGTLIANLSPGIQISSLTGAAGGRSNITIRGNTSIGSNIDANTAFSNPLYVVDGVQTSLEDLAGYNVSNVDFLASLNPNDIESIDILKDASAAAIYGSRGANGVIIIKTKGGLALSEPEFSFTANVGIQPKPDLVPMLVGTAERREKMEMIQRWWSPQELQTGQTPMVLSDSLNPAFNNNMDYQGMFYRPGTQQQYNFSVRAGSEVSNYRISLGYSNNKGVVKNTGFDRYTLNANFNTKLKEKFKNSFRVNFSYTDNKTGQGNPYLYSTGHGSYNLSSSLPISPANSNSSLFYVSDERKKLLTGQLDELLNTSRAINVTFTNFANYDILKSLSLNSQLTYTYNSTKKNFYEPSIVRAAGNGVASYSLYNRNNLASDLYLSYFKNFGEDHEVTAVLGNRVDYNKYENLGLSAIGFGSDAIKVVNGRYTQDEIGGFSSISANALLSYFGRFSYKYKDRYIIKGTYSVDGSSRFGKDVRWAKFSSVGAGWIFSEEPFLKSLSNILDYGKFRLSWGVNGKQFGNNYARFGAYNLGYGGEPYGTNQLDVSTYGGVTGVIPNYGSIANQGASWENAKQWDFGVDLDFFNKRLNITYDAYHKKSDQLFFNVAFPQYAGFTGAAMNVAGVVNYGWETSATYHVFPRNNDFRLELTGNISRNRNYVSELPNGGRDYVNTNQNYGYVVGRPLNIPRMFVNDYIIDDLSQLPVNPYTGQPLEGKSAWAAIRPGFPIWKDLNGDYLLEETGDYQLAREFSPTPDFTGAFNVNIKYKGWYFQAYSQFSFGADIKNTVLQGYLDAYDRSGDNWATKALVDLSEHSFWEQPGDGAAGVRFPALYPAAGSLGGPFYGFRSQQTMWIESGDYWRVSNMSFGYTFNNEQIKNLGLKRLRLYASVLNPYQWQRSKSVVDASLVNALGNTLGNPYPRSKTFSIGVNAKF